MQMGISKSVSSRSVSGRVKEAADTILGTGADKADVMYDSRSGALLTFLLLFIVGWIPTIGQMVAGYVGGRRSGSPYRGFFATTAATVCVLVILTLIAFALDSINGALITDSQAQLDALREQSPVLADLAAPVVDYLKAMFGGASLSVAYASYAITPVFGVIGGVVSNQMQKEIRYIIRTAGKEPGQHVRSLDRLRLGKPMGFTYSQISGLTANSGAPAPYTPAQRVQDLGAFAEPVPVSETKVVDTTVGIHTEEVPAKRPVPRKYDFNSVLKTRKKVQTDIIQEATPTSNLGVTASVTDTADTVPEVRTFDDVPEEIVPAVPSESKKTDDDSEYL